MVCGHVVKEVGLVLFVKREMLLFGEVTDGYIFEDGVYFVCGFEFM